MTDLGTLGGTNSFATDVNNRGEIVGGSDLPDGTIGAFLWRSGRLIDLGTLGGDFTWATAVNDRGDVVGLASTAGGMHAFVWHRGMMQDLGAPVDGFSRAYDVNDRGQVVGEVSVDGMNSVPVRWQRGGSHRLTGRFGVAAAVNDRGQVAGYFYDGGSFLWSRGQLVDLGGVPGATVTQAQGINERGQVVGYTGIDAFLWQRGRINALPRLTGSTTGARDINSCGQIVGYSATTPDGVNYHAVLWTR
jgi:probable HAF family extracellular repeat protein